MVLSSQIIHRLVQRSLSITKRSLGCTKITYYKAFTGLYTDHVLQAFIGLYKHSFGCTKITYYKAFILTHLVCLHFNQNYNGDTFNDLFYLDDLEQNMIFVICYILSVIVFEARVQSSLSSIVSSITSDF